MYVFIVLFYIAFIQYSVLVCYWTRVYQGINNNYYSVILNIIYSIILLQYTVIIVL